ncbi:lachrymatory-factor synthase-like [Salvia miltiorrhiza]|uniref:lachrymatory-factor synthase-like n=1 Tax=Salvia miltiorrhiza TaxID=226208 RepID=UPI0025AC641E|nr:lachrymatory-factor synthase-like [Salvia miltiorrhiza]
MDQNLSNQKWQAKVCTRLEKAEADQIWPFFLDFFGLHKWFPGLPACRGVHGANGEPGCIRYCSGFGLKQAANADSESGPSSLVSWSKERLVAVDHAQKTFTYEIVDCNIGFKSYVSTIKVVPGGGDGDGGGGGCAVEWWISLEPVEGCELEDLVVKYEVGLRLMVKKMEDAIFGSS